MPFRFVHTADIHLDSPLKSLALRDPELASLVRNSTRRAFVNAIDLCLEERVQAFLIAGDLYDGDQTSMKTARFLAEQLRRLHEANIATFIVRGNHDALSKITRELILPPSTTVFDGRGEVVEVAGPLPIAIHGLSFAKPQAPEGLLGKYKAPVPGAFNIGIMHTSLGVTTGHDLYAPCSLADLTKHGMHYWALGHIHKRSVSCDDPMVVMPGNPQGRDINESGPKSVTLATVLDGGTVTIEERLTAVAQFERIEVDISDTKDWKEIVDKARSALEQSQSLVQAEYLVSRIHFVGQSPLVWRIRRDLDLLKTQLDSDAPSKCFIEKLEVECAPALVPNMSIDGGDPVFELRDLIYSDVLKSNAFMDELVQAATELRKHLPHECRDSLGQDEAKSRTLLSELAAEGTDDVISRLQATERMDLKCD